MRAKLKFVGGRRLVSVTVVLSVALALAACDLFRVSSYYQQGAIATASPVAAEVGEQVFGNGGNAFDVAVAVGFALAVAYPQAGNIGGGGFAVVRDGRTGELVSLDFRETAPAAATATMYLDSAGEVLPGSSTFGARAVGVPGTVAGLRALWQQYGSLPWADLVRPAAHLADSGFVVDSFLVKDLVADRDSMTAFPATAEIFYPGGTSLNSGDRLVQKDLAATLFAIADEGPDVFYRGRIADLIDSCMRAFGGLITRNDLAAYHPVWREPIHFRFDDVDIYSMAPPSSGGIVMGQILGLLEPFDLSRYIPTSPEYLHLFTEASRLAFADRAEHLGDPDFRPIPSALLDSGYLAERRKLINSQVAGSSAQVSAGNPFAFEHNQTTHFSVADREGNMVAITYTLNGSFGSRVVVPGAGFLLNNEMDDFAIKAGFPNKYGLVGGEANKIEPGKRMLSSMSPTLVIKDGKPLFLLGSRGGSKIITAVAQTILAIVRFGVTPERAAALPRFHHQWLPDVLYLEQDGFDVATIQTLIRYGHHVQLRSRYGDVELIAIDESGLLQPVCDPREGGRPAGI